MSDKKKQLLRFIEFTKMVLDRPPMFMIEDVEGLSLMLYGFQCGVAVPGETNHISELLVDFRRFINEDLRSIDDVDWPRLIRFYSSGNKESLDMFKDKFERFVESHHLL